MWQLYIIRCKDGSLYTGITNDLARRVEEHMQQGATCAKYLRGKAPLTLVYTVTVGSRSDALKAEHRVKKLARTGKEALVSGEMALRDLLPG